MAIGTIEIPASALFQFLQACQVFLAKTKSGEATDLDSIHISTTTGEYGTEAGKGTLLVGTSSDGISASQMTTVCAGALNRPVLIDTSRLQTIYPWLKMVARAAKKGDTSEPIVHWSILDSYGSTMRAAATEAESLLVNTSPADDYPAAETDAILAGRENGPAMITDKDDRELPVGCMFSLGQSQQKLLAVHKVLGGRIDYYPPKHPAGQWTVEDKANGWRGSIKGEEYGVDDDVDNPEVELRAIGQD